MMNSFISFSLFYFDSEHTKNIANFCQGIELLKRMDNCGKHKFKSLYISLSKYGFFWQNRLGDLIEVLYQLCYKTVS